MMLRPATRKLGRIARPRSQSYATPAPIGGWNARDALANMEEGDATILDNWFPEQSAVRVRRGTESHATGLTDAVETIMVWRGFSAEKMFGSSNSAVYETTSSGAVGSAEFSGLTSTRWQWVNFANSAGSFLYIVNGSDAPRYYDGSSWTTPTITGSGLTASNLIHVMVFKRRLFFVEKNSLSFWYFPVETISGSITEFDLGPVCPKGGFLMAAGSWTLDGGSGPDDYAAFMTSEGQVAIFQGTDPGSASAWSHVGTFDIGPPVGRRCFESIGGELVALTNDGVVPVSMFLRSGRSQPALALSDKISGAYAAATRDFAGNFGWQAQYYPKGTMLVVNVPVTERTTSRQFVRNTNTGAWCRFLNINANCFAIFNDDLYFGGDGEIFKADTGNTDNSGNIDGEVRTAFSYLGNRGTNKAFQQARPVLSSNGTVSVAMSVDVDFDDVQPTGTPTFLASVGAEWDVATWDIADWGDANQITNDWKGVAGFGRCAAIRFRTATQGELKWTATDWLYEPGGLN